MSGSCSASWASAARRRALLLGPARRTRRPRAPAAGSARSPPRPAAARRSRRRRGPRPARGPSPSRPAVEDVAPRRTGRGEHLDRGRLRLLSPADAHALARPQRAGEQADVGDALARGRALDLEHAARDRRLRVAAARPTRSSSMPASSSSMPMPSAAEPKNTGWTEPLPRLRGRAARAGARYESAASSRDEGAAGSPRRARRGPRSAPSDGPRRRR